MFDLKRVFLHSPRFTSQRRQNKTAKREGRKVRPFEAIDCFGLQGKAAMDFERFGSWYLQYSDFQVPGPGTDPDTLADYAYILGRKQLDFRNNSCQTDNMIPKNYFGKLVRKIFQFYPGNKLSPQF